MKKSILLLGAVPVLCGAIGYGAGMALKPAPAVAAADPQAQHGAAEAVLDRLAEEAPEAVPHPPAAGHGDDDGAHAEPEQQVAQAEPAAGHGGHAAAKAAEGGADDSKVVTIGRISVPVYKANSVTYVVADFGVAVADQALAEHYSVAENAIRLRDAILTSMHHAAETPMLMGAAIDSERLAQTVAADLKPEFDGVEDVLFLSLHKTDVPRS